MYIHTNLYSQNRENESEVLAPDNETGKGRLEEMEF